MNILEQLTNKLDNITLEFQLLLKENEKLRKELEDLKNKNDLFTRSNQDVTMMITNILKKDGQL
jgi:uncharacterized membrane protein